MVSERAVRSVRILPEMSVLHVVAGRNSSWGQPAPPRPLQARRKLRPLWWLQMRRQTLAWPRREKSPVLGRGRALRCVMQSTRDRPDILVRLGPLGVWTVVLVVEIVLAILSA